MGLEGSVQQNDGFVSNALQGLLVGYVAHVYAGNFDGAKLPQTVTWMIYGLLQTSLTASTHVNMLASRSM